MFNYSSPSVKNSALLALASIPHKLAGRLIFGIWCRAELLFLLSSVGLLNTQAHVHTQKYMHGYQWCPVSVSSASETPPLKCWASVHKHLYNRSEVFFYNTTVNAVTVKSTAGKNMFDLV